MKFSVELKAFVNYIITIFLNYHLILKSAISFEKKSNVVRLCWKKVHFHSTLLYRIAFILNLILKGGFSTLLTPVDLLTQKVKIAIQRIRGCKKLSILPLFLHSQMPRGLTCSCERPLLAPASAPYLLLLSPIS